MEVIAATIILSTVLVGVLMARSRFIRQYQIAQRRIAAVGVADSLMSQWWKEPGKFPRSASGQVSLDSSLSWRTRVARTVTVQGLDCDVVKVDVFESGATAAHVLASVEVLLPPATGAEGERPSQ